MSQKLSNLLIESCKMKENYLALELLKRNMKLESKDKDGKTALSYAASNSNIEVVEMMINKGANINALNNIK